MVTARGPRGPYAKTALRRAEIVRAASMLFSTEGYEGASLRSIAARVGITHPALLHHFASKEELLAAVLEEQDSQERQDLPESTVLTLDGLAAALAGLIARHQEVPHLMRLLVNVSAAATRPSYPGHAYVVDRYGTVRAELTAAFAALQAAGEVDSRVDCRTLANTVIAVLDGLQIQWLLDPTVDTAKTLADFLERYRARP